MSQSIRHIWIEREDGKAIICPETGTSIYIASYHDEHDLCVDGFRETDIPYEIMRKASYDAVARRFEEIKKALHVV